MNFNYKLFPKQKEFLQSEAPITYLCCGRGFGKSYVASLLIVINFLQGKRIIALAQNFKALNEVLFQEIRNRLEELEIPAHIDKNAMKITYGDGVIYGASYEGIESIRGLSKISLAVCDEAALSPPKLFETLTPCLRGDGITGKVRLLSTPRRGSWLNLYCKEHSEKVEVIKATTMDNKLITPEQIELMRSTIVNPEIMKQELEGVMLDIDSDASVIQLSEYPMFDNGIELDDNYMGIDLSGLGSDNNVFTVVNKYRILDMVSVNKADSFELCNVAERLIQQYHVKGCYIDITGSTSCGLLDLLKAKNHPVEGINFAQKPYEERYTNARAEMYVETSKAIKAGLYVENRDIKTQLSYTTISVNNTGKFQLCKKDEIKEMIGHSPDEADSFALAVYAMNHSSNTINEAKHASDIANKYLNYLKWSS
jgi:hypothetical protein